MIHISDFVYVFPCGYVAVLDVAQRCKVHGERPVLIGYVGLDEKYVDMSRAIGARKSLGDKGELVVFDNVESALEDMYGALVGSEVVELVACADNLKRELG